MLRTTPDAVGWSRCVDDGRPPASEGAMTGTLLAGHGLGVPNRPPTAVGYVDLLGVALIVPATMLTTGIGAHLAHAIDARMLRRVFALFLVLTALRMFYGLLAGR